MMEMPRLSPQCQSRFQDAEKMRACMGGRCGDDFEQSCQLHALTFSR
jgi:hypothetical protein